MLRISSLILVVAVCIAMLIAAGCGTGDNPDKDGIETAISGYLSALAHGDGEAACSHLSGNGRRELAQLAFQMHAVDCATLAKEATSVFGAPGISRLSKATVSVGEIHGDEATAEIEGATAVELTLIKSDGEWLIDSGFVP
jgi:hypothetical protein